MRKYFQITTVLSVLFFLVWLRNAKLGDDIVVSIKPNQLSPTPFLTETPTPSEATKPVQNINKPLPTIALTNPPLLPTATPVSAGMYKNGSFTGSVQDAYYGNIQVQAIINGGKITDVIFLQYPNDNGTSRSINSQAIPLLKQEAIQAQSANVSGVSGASATSPAFIASLTDALVQAKN